MALLWQDNADMAASNPSYEVFFPELMRVEPPQPQTSYSSSAESSFDDAENFPPYQFVTYFDAYTDAVDDSHEHEHSWDGWSSSMDSPHDDELTAPFNIPAPIIANPNPSPAPAPRSTMASKSTSASSEDEEDDYNGARNFVCPIDSCGRRYKHKGDLKSHVQKLHKEQSELPNVISKPRSSKVEKTFQCPMAHCKCGYDRHRDLLRHYRLKHMELYQETLREKQLRQVEHEARMNIRFDSNRQTQEFCGMVSVFTL